MEPSAAERQPRSAAWAGATVALGVLALWGLEEATWRLVGRPAEQPTVLWVAILLALALGTAAAGLRRWLGPFWVGGLILVAVAAVSLTKPSVAVGAPSLGSWSLAVPVAVGVSALLIWTAARRRGLFILGLLALIAWVAGPRRAQPWLAPAKSGPDIVLLVMDTTRRDHLSLYGYPRPTSPALDAFAREAQVYEDAWSVSPWTPPSHASMLTGLLPAQHGVDGSQPPDFPADLLSLPSVLRGFGYANGGFVANPSLLAPGWSVDFHEYRGPLYTGGHSLVRRLNRWLLRSENEWYATHTSRRVLALARRWWRQNEGRPRFLLINLLDPHMPYNPPNDSLRELFPDLDREEALAIDQDSTTYHVHPGLSPPQARMLRALYDAELLAMDREIGAFLGWLRERGELDSTIVVITSDHGERLGERGWVGHDLVMDPHLLRVPLVVRYPPRTTAGRVARRVQLDGLAGYILHLAGIPAPDAMTASALHRQDRRVVVAQYQKPTWFLNRLKGRSPDFDTSPYEDDWFFVADQRYAYTCVASMDRRCQLNDMQSDPEWQRDAGDQQLEVLTDLEAAARSLPRFRPARPGATDPELKEHLRLLGYVE